MKSQLILQGEDLIESFTQDVEPIMEECKALHNAGQFGSMEMRHAAMVPEALVIEYNKRTGITMHEFMANSEHMKRFLEDPAISHFRIWKGKL